MLPVIVVALIIFDQISKVLMLSLLKPYQSIPVIPGIFHITLVFNRGAAFGMLKDKIPLFIATSIAAIVLILHHFRRRPKTVGLYDLSLCLILAGAVGNLIDRVFRGCVVDFLDFRIWPVFNVADSCITIGAVLLGYHLLKGQAKQDNKGAKGL